MKKISFLKNKKVLITIVLVAVFAAANIFVSNISVSTPDEKIGLTLSTSALVSYANNESGDVQSAWQSFWSSVGQWFSNAWDAVSSFCDDFFGSGNWSAYHPGNPNEVYGNEYYQHNGIQNISIEWGFGYTINF